MHANTSMPRNADLIDMMMSCVMLDDAAPARRRMRREQRKE
jgi:hypothetical protein